MTGSLNQIADFVARYYVAVAHLSAFYVLAICAAIFIPLSVFAAGKAGQPPIHKGMIPDVLYWFAGPLIYAHATVLMFTFLVSTGLYSLDDLGQVTDGMVPVLLLPAMLQAVLVLLIMDLVEYWIHRLFHTGGLWKFHAIHHSAVN